MGNLIKELYNNLGIRSFSTTSFNPQANGCTERVNQTIISLVNKGLGDGGNWVERLEEATFVYNTYTHSVTGYSPYFMVFGIAPNLPTQFLLKGVLNTTFQRRIEGVAKMRDIIKVTRILFSDWWF